MSLKFAFELRLKADGTQLGTQTQYKLLLQFGRVRSYKQRCTVRGEVDHEVKQRVERVMCLWVFYTRVYARDLDELMSWKKQRMARAMHGRH